MQARSGCRLASANPFQPLDAALCLQLPTAAFCLPANTYRPPPPAPLCCLNTAASPAWQPICGAFSLGTQLGMPTALEGDSWSVEAGRSTTDTCLPVRLLATVMRAGMPATTELSMRFMALACEKETAQESVGDSGRDRADSSR